MYGHLCKNAHIQTIKVSYCWSSGVRHRCIVLLLKNSVGAVRYTRFGVLKLHLKETWFIARGCSVCARATAVICHLILTKAVQYWRKAECSQPLVEHLELRGIA